MITEMWVFHEEPRWLVDPPTVWAGHRRWVYDYIAYATPHRIVELGVGDGGSFFPMCQAIQDFSPFTQIVGVDHSLKHYIAPGPVPEWNNGNFVTTPVEAQWGDMVMQAQLKEHYPLVQARLMEMHFSDALPTFEPESIDLLHIDGEHDFASVLHDWITWEQKLSPNAVVLFHDTREEGPERLMFDLRNRGERVFEFHHNNGLGILFRGNSYKGVQLTHDYKGWDLAPWHSAQPMEV